MQSTGTKLEILPGSPTFPHNACPVTTHQDVHVEKFKSTVRGQHTVFLIPLRGTWASVTSLVTVTANGFSHHVTDCQPIRQADFIVTSSTIDDGHVSKPADI